MKYFRESGWLDGAGVWLSGLCLIHCFLTPIVLILLPAFALVEVGEFLHLASVFVLPAIAVFSFVPGYVLHRNASILVAGFFGLIFIVAGALLEEDVPRLYETGLTVLGGVLLISAHLRNRRMSINCHPHERCA